MIYYLALIAGIVLVVVFLRRPRRHSLGLIPGPPSRSFVLGNLRELVQGNAGDTVLEWRRRYGSFIRYRATFGEDRLLISDPKALQYIFNTAAYTFQKPEDTRAILHELNGPDLLWAEGDVHKRQRRVMLPAFGAPEAKALYPIFQSMVERLTARWQTIIENNTGTSYEELDVHGWLSRATLDAIGEAAFDYPLGALDDAETPLGRAYNNLIADANGIRDATRFIVDGVMSRMPTFLVTLIFKLLPAKRIARMRKAKQTSYAVAKELIAAKGEAILEGKTNKDVMSLLVKANLSETGSRRLAETELYAEMSVILLAGHETTATSLSWILWDLAHRPDIQKRLRAEVVECHARSRSQGQQYLSLSDIEKMPYFQAVLKETMRIHPAVQATSRVAARDAVVPLSKPMRLASGEVVEKLVVTKGTHLTLSYYCYNHDRDLWGGDADEFKPERWLSEHAQSPKSVSLGVIGNLMNFSSGQRSCIGWRFAMTEMQCFFAELIRNFEFTIDPEKRIRKDGDGLIFPLVIGEEHKGSLLPLRVSVVPQD